MALKTKEAINHALDDLGYYHYIDGTWSSPSISLREMIYALCNYLDVKVVKDAEPRAVAVRKLPTRAKKEKK